MAFRGGEFRSDADEARQVFEQDLDRIRRGQPFIGQDPVVGQEDDMWGDGAYAEDHELDEVDRALIEAAKERAGFYGAEPGSSPPKSGPVDAEVVDPPAAPDAVLGGTAVRGYEPQAQEPTATTPAGRTAQAAEVDELLGTTPHPHADLKNLEDATPSARETTRPVTDTVAANRDAREGTEPISVRLAERQPPDDPFDAHLVHERKVALVGDHKAALDAALFHVVSAHVENLENEGRGGVVVAARFAPRSDTYLVTHAEVGGYNVVDLKVSGQDGLLSVLDKDQTVEALASAAAGEDENRLGAYEQILSSISNALSARRPPHPETGEPGKPTLHELRDGVRVFRDMRVGRRFEEITALTDPADRVAVRDGLPEAVRKALDSHFEPLGNWLDKYIRDTTDRRVADTDPEAAGAAAGEAGPPDNFRPERITVVNVGVQGYGRFLRQEGTVLTQALLPLVVERLPWGQPRVLVVTDAEYAEQRALDELARHCEAQGIKLVVTVHKVTDRSLPLITGGGWGIMPIDPLQAELVSKAVGTEVAPELTGASHNVSGNVGKGEHTSKNASFKRNDITAQLTPDGRPIPESASEGFSEDDTDGEAHGYTENVAPVSAIIHPAELRTQMRSGYEITVVTSAGTRPGVFSALTRQYLRAYDVSHRRPQLDERVQIRRIQAGYQPTPLPAAPSGRSSDRGELPAGEEARALPAGARGQQHALPAGPTAGHPQGQAAGSQPPPRTAMQQAREDMDRATRQVSATPPRTSHQQYDHLAQNYRAQFPNSHTRGRAFRNWAAGQGWSVNHRYMTATRLPPRNQEEQ